jgi:D-glycero-D-manno-heptose 1,7-bisphosphate phosphatase
MRSGLPVAALLDRDGTINVKAPEGEYVTRPEDVELLPGAAHAIALLNAASIPVVVVTNQRGIALGRMTEDDLDAIHTRLAAELQEAGGAHVDVFLHCPHEKGTCGCRKPGTLMLLRARDVLGLPSLRQAVMIGDAVSDVRAGHAAGANTVLLGAGIGHADADAVAPDLLTAVRRALDPL